MTVATTRSADDLVRRLARLRSATRTVPVRPEDHEPGPRHSAQDLAARLAAAVDGDVVRAPHGILVRRETPSIPMPLDRERLARLPGQPGPDVPLVCLDTETTGLATAAGTVAFLIGLGWWEGDRFRQVQLLLPDHGEERAVLEALGDHVPAVGWLVTYNGRGFDWPLLVARYRMAGRPPPVLGGHLDLLPVVRRLFRHRLENARLITAEQGLLDLRRHDDVDGWEIPGRYLGFLRGGPVGPLVDVVRHNDQDVRSLARLLVLLERDYATSDARRGAPPGDLAGLARAYARNGSFDAALDCYDGALEGALRGAIPDGPTVAPSVAPWWAPGGPVDFGGRPASRARSGAPERAANLTQPWTTDRISTERAHLLRRLGRWDEAAAAWTALAAGPGRTAVIAAIELAKLREHRLRDPDGALLATQEGLRLAERRRRLGRPEVRLETDLGVRASRLRRRLLGATRPARQERRSMSS